MSEGTAQVKAATKTFPAKSFAAQSPTSGLGAHAIVHETRFRPTCRSKSYFAGFAIRICTKRGTNGKR